MKKREHPIEVFDHMDGCCYVNSGVVRSKIRRSAKCITYGPSQEGRYGTTQDVLMDGVKVGYRFFSY